MRRLADALPTLRDAPLGGHAAAHGGFRAERFDPPAIRPARDASDGADVASIRSMLLKKQHGEPVEQVGPKPKPTPPFARSLAAASPIPMLDGPRESREEAVAAAVAAARTDAEREKTAAVELARKVERDVAARAVAEARAAFVAEEGALFRSRFAEAFEALHVRLSDAFGRVLAPIADAAVRDVAARRFAAVLDDLVAVDAPVSALTVRGPKDLVDAVRHAMGEPTGIAFVVGPEPDLTVDIVDTRLETMLAAFAETLAAAVAPTFIVAPAETNEPEVAAEPTVAADLASAPDEEEREHAR